MKKQLVRVALVSGVATLISLGLAMRAIAAPPVVPGDLGDAKGGKSYKTYLVRALAECTDPNVTNVGDDVPVGCDASLVAPATVKFGSASLSVSKKAKNSSVVALKGKDFDPTVQVRVWLKLRSTQDTSKGVVTFPDQEVECPCVTAVAGKLKSKQNLVPDCLSTDLAGLNWGNVQVVDAALRTCSDNLDLGVPGVRSDRPTP
jgi:hypothetical protein